MRDAIEVQHELDAAQSGLEDKVGKLKELLEEKLETPRHIIQTIEKPISFLRAHPAAVAAALFGFGIVLFTLRRLAR